jgi:short-subunit dehydrogenase
MVESTLARWGKADILVANAGAYVRGRVMDLTIEDLERAMAVNFYGAVYCVLAVLPNMVARRRGHIVLVNSMDAKKAIPLDAPYASSKFALAGFGEVLRQELHGTGIYVTSVFPGRVDTSMIAHLKVPWISSKISADSVANAIVRSIYRREPEVVIPSIARALIYLNTFSPRLADWAVCQFHLEGWEK